MKILVVHPYDESTNVLEKVYSGKPVDVLHRQDLTREEVEAAIEAGNYDRVVLMGHGTPEGLCNMHTKSYVFDHGSYRNKVRPRGIEVIAIWCHANVFFLKYDDLKDVFFTGMFVSEMKEAREYIAESVDDVTIDTQFRNFANVLRRAIELPIGDVRKYIKENYTGGDPVTAFNRECLGFE
jgi:hypothetical protein